MKSKSSQKKSKSSKKHNAKSKTVKKKTTHHNQKDTSSQTDGSTDFLSPESLETDAALESDESLESGAMRSSLPAGLSADSFELDTELHSQSSEPFVGKWNHLVSTSNWEKGRIIFQWREALIEGDAPATQYSDEAWSQLVGGVTSQHVGRLRRVFQTFGESKNDYDGLFWSHFHAAIDWNDPELWLEGAIQNGWSVSQMRKQRWETMGKLPDEDPENYSVISAELDEDFEPAINKEPQTGDGNVATGPLAEGPDFGDEGNLNAAGKADDGSKIYSEEDAESIDFVRPFENIGEMPEDLMEAFDAYKLAILHHKTSGWQQISRDDILASLDALKELVKAPGADSDAPF